MLGTKVADEDGKKKAMYIEPYFGGSHKSLIQILEKHYPGDVLAMRPKKWHW